MYELLTNALTNATFWTAFGAIATAVAAFGILHARAQVKLVRQQFRLECWLKAQEIFTEERFTTERGKIFKRLEKPEQLWTEQEKDEAKLVCRKMSELADLRPVLEEKKMLDTWDDPVGKAWFLLKPIVEEERKRCHWPKKWQSFQDLGRVALDKLVREGRDPRTMRRKEGKAA